MSGATEQHPAQALAPAGMDLGELALEMADELAKGDLDAMCLAVNSGNRTWLDTSKCNLEQWYFVDRAVKYLERRGQASTVGRLVRCQAFPSLVRIEEQRCRVCGCTELSACEGGCSWIAADLCSACAGK